MNIEFKCRKKAWRPKIIRVFLSVCYRENIGRVTHTDPHSFRIIESCFNSFSTAGPPRNVVFREAAKRVRTRIIFVIHRIRSGPCSPPLQPPHTHGQPRLADLDTRNHFRGVHTPLRVGHLMHVLWFSGTRLSRVSTQGFEHPSRSLGEKPPTPESTT